MSSKDGKDDDDPKDESFLDQAKRLARKALDSVEKITQRITRPEPPPAPEPAAETKPSESGGLSPAIRPQADRPTSPSMPWTRLPDPQPGFSAPQRAQEPFGMLDVEEPPETYGVDEVMILYRDPYTLFAYWEVTQDAWNAARAALGGDGKLILRVYSVSARPEGGAATETVDLDLDWDHGRLYLAAPAPGAHVTAAVGLRAPDGRFAPMAHSPRIRVPYAEPGPDGPVEWMDVEPNRTKGGEVEPPRIRQRGPAHALAGASLKGLPRWNQGLWEHTAGSRVPLRPEDRPKWEDMPSSPWRWNKQREEREKGGK